MTSKSGQSSLLDRAFPFHFALDEAGRFVEAGPRLRELAGDAIASARFFELNAIDGPRPVRNFSELLAGDGDVNVVDLPFLGGVRLRGEFVADPGSPDRVIFLGHPWLTDLGGLAEFGLDLNDFPPHSGLSDMLVNLQARESVNQDLKRLAEQLRDRTRALEAELENRAALEERLQQSQKMEALGRLAGGVAHDFNNALTAISGHASLGDMATDLAGAKRHLTAIADASRRAADITGRLLGFARRKRIELEDCPVRAILADAEAMLEPILGAEVNLRVVCDDDAGLVRTDPGSLQQALINLVNNSRDASPPGSPIEIRAKRLRDRKASKMVGIVRPPDDWVVIEVADRGAGMAPEVRDRIFEPFFTTKDLGEGTGLGLSTVWWIVERSGGAVEVDSEPGVGTTFRLFLPSATKPEVAGEPTRSPATVGGRRRILFVEDDETSREATSALLRSSGWQVEEAGSGKEAMEIADRSLHPFDILLTDLVMDGMSGEELAKVMQTRQPWIRVVLVTAYDPTEAGDLGNATVIAKPFDIEVLQRALADASGDG